MGPRPRLLSADADAARGWLVGGSWVARGWLVGGWLRTCADVLGLGSARAFVMRYFTPLAGSRSVCVWRGGEQGQLGSIGRLEHGEPPVEVGAADRVAVPGWLRVSGLDAPPEFVRRHLEEVQFNGDTKATRRGAHLVTFDARPEPKIEDDAQTEAQDFLGEAPEFVFDLLPGRLVPGCGAEGPEPFILREAHRAPVGG